MEEPHQFQWRIEAHGQGWSPLQLQTGHYHLYDTKKRHNQQHECITLRLQNRGNRSYSRWALKKFSRCKFNPPHPFIHTQVWWPEITVTICHELHPHPNIGSLPSLSRPWSLFWLLDIVRAYNWAIVVELLPCSCPMSRWREEGEGHIDGYAPSWNACA